jgi:hypothetical protein
MIILGFDTATINWYLVLYVVLSLVFLGYGTNAIYSTGQIRGVMFGIGSAIVLIYFGLRWFSSPDDSTAGEWPPVINMCPDYLTFIPTIKVDSGSTRTESACADLLGVATSKSSNTANTLQKIKLADVGALYKSNTNRIFKWSSSDITSAIAANNNEQILTICNACKEAGITWEGVFDGDTCVALNKFKNAQAAIKQCLVSY